MGVLYPFGDPVVIKSGPNVIQTQAEPDSIYDDLTGIFHSMGTSLGGAWNEASDYVSDVWDTTKLTAQGAVIVAGENIDSAVSEVKTSFSDALNLGDGLISWVQGKLVFIIGIGLVVIFVLAKSGILTQVADTFRAVYGG